MEISNYYREILDRQKITPTEDFKINDSFPMYIISSYGRVFSLSLTKFLKHHNDGAYLQVFLTYRDENENRIRKWQKIHRLVLSTFGSACPGSAKLIWCNHKNGLKTDNRIENLEWTTISENIQHAFNIGLHVIPSGKDHWRYGKSATNDTRKMMSEKRKLYWVEWRKKKNIEFNTLKTA